MKFSDIASSDSVYGVTYEHLRLGGGEELVVVARIGGEVSPVSATTGFFIEVECSVVEVL